MECLKRGCFEGLSVAASILIFINRNFPLLPSTRVSVHYLYIPLLHTDVDVYPIKQYSCTWQQSTYKNPAILFTMPVFAFEQQFAKQSQISCTPCA